VSVGALIIPYLSLLLEIYYVVSVVLFVRMSYNFTISQVVSQYVHRVPEKKTKKPLLFSI